MELKQIKDLMAAMGRTGTKRLILKKENFELTLEREEHAETRFVEHAFELDEHFKQPVNWKRADHPLPRFSESSSGKLIAPNSLESSQEDANSQYVTSPMVGTFYISPSPGDEAFVKVGDRVEKNHVVCIIEAMKVMNEIKANVTGTIVEVLVETGQPVEFGTKLFRITE